MSLLWDEWISHTNFSFLVGASHPEEMVERAFSLGYRSLAISDFDGGYGLARSFRAFRAIRSRELQTNFKLYYGAELHLARDHELPILLQDTVVLLAKNQNGYFNLNCIMSQSHREGKRNAHLPITDLLDSNVDDLVAILPMRGLIRSASASAYEKRLDALKEKFSGRCYIALTSLLSPENDSWLDQAWKSAVRHRIPYLMSQDSFFHTRSRKDLSDVLHAIRKNLSLQEASSHFFSNTERCLHSLEELSQIYSRFPFFDQASRYSLELSDQFDFDLSQLTYQYPKEMIPEGFDSFTFLQDLSWQEARRIYGKDLPSKVSEQITFELKLVNDLAFADYFLTVWDIVSWARRQGILCQGRGSAANSAICYVLGITAIDPNRFDLLFERFISAERGDPPDIDVDFEHERREEVIQYIYQRFGRSRAAMVANVITFRSRGSFRAVGKALGIPIEIIEQGARLMVDRDFRQNHGQSLIEALRKEYPEQDSITLMYWQSLSERLMGFPRHLGIHSGGFVIVQDAIERLTSQEPATMPGRTVLIWCKEDIEALGFFKIDILALGILSALRKCMDSVQECYGQSLSLSTIPQEDPATYQMIQSADTVGTFQIESRAQMAMLPRLRPMTFYDLVVEVGIVRPGPIQGGFVHPYLKRRRGLERVDYPHPCLKPILERTLGIPIFQEQIMRMAMAVGGFSGGEADELRRQMGAWQIRGDMLPMIAKMAEGMRKFGIEERFIEQVLQQIKGFAEYGFPESHAASFALLAYASSYLKCHFPASFVVALLNSQPMGFYSAHALLQDAKRHAIEILPISIFYSTWDHQLEKRTTGDWAVRLGYRVVNGLRRQAADQIVAVRSAQPERPWSGFEDFVLRTGLFQHDLLYLAAANAFADLGLSRKTAIWAASAAPIAELMEEDSLFGSFGNEDVRESLHYDLAATSTTLGIHPAQLIRESYWCFACPPQKVTRSVDIRGKRAGSELAVFGMVLVRQAPGSAKGMVFLTLEDETGFINLVFTPAISKLYRSMINHQGFLCAIGVLQSEREGHSILVRRIEAQVPKQGSVVPLQRLETDPVPLPEARNYM